MFTHSNRLFAVVAALMLLLAAPSHADVQNAQGKITFLRVHDVGTGWGPANDFLDAEVIVRLSGHTSKAFGFQLRQDGNRAARQGMLDLLRDAFASGAAISIDFDVAPGKNNGRIFRVMLTK
jgi:hypothetical protein